MPRVKVIFSFFNDKIGLEGLYYLNFKEFGCFYLVDYRNIYKGIKKE